MKWFNIYRASAANIRPKKKLCKSRSKHYPRYIQHIIRFDIFPHINDLIDRTVNLQFELQFLRPAFSQFIHTSMTHGVSNSIWIYQATHADVPPLDKPWKYTKYCHRGTLTDQNTKLYWCQHAVLHFIKFCCILPNFVWKTIEKYELIGSEAPLKLSRSYRICWWIDRTMVETGFMSLTFIINKQNAFACVKVLEIDAYKRL